MVRHSTLDGKVWMRYSISVWDIVKTSHENRMRHPAMFPVELCRRLIQIYTHKGGTVLDPFMGSGSAIVAAKQLGRKGIGIDINPEFVELARRRLAQRLLGESAYVPETYCHDATKLLEIINPNSIDLVITSPPYWNIHRRRRTADYKELRFYSELVSDLGNIDDYQRFMNSLKSVFQQVHTALKTGKRCIVVVMDIRVGNNFIPFHMDIAREMGELGFILEDIIIWDRRKEYNNLRPLGYPYSFIVNKVHEYILIFRKGSVAC